MEQESNSLNNQEVTQMLNLIYDQVEPYQGVYFVRSGGTGCFKIVSSTGEIIKDTEISEVVSTDRYVFFRTPGTLSWMRSEGIDKLRHPTYLDAFDISKLPNGALIFRNYSGAGVLSKSGNILISGIYNVLKPIQERPNGDLVMFYLINLGYGVAYKGNLVLSADGYHTDKILSVPIGDTLSIDYVPTEANKSWATTIGTVLERNKCRLVYNGTQVGENVYDEIIQDSALERFGLVKVANYLLGRNQPPCVGLITLLGEEVIPPLKYSGIEVVNPRKFLCYNSTGKYALYDWNQEIPTAYDIVGYKSLMTLPLVSVIMRVNSENVLLSYGNDGKFHSKPYNCMDIWEYSPNGKPSGMFLIKLYESYYYTDCLFKLLPVSQTAELKKASPQDWVYRAFSNEGDMVV